MRPSSLQEALQIAERMAADPALAVNLAGLLSDTIQRLPPPAEVLLSRPVFERCSLWTLATTFFEVLPEGEPPPQEIRIPHDSWIRGVVAQAYPLITQLEFDVDELEERLDLFRAICSTSGTNGRGLFEVNWRLNSKQGFISRGAQGEILSPASLAAGDGFYYAPLDWRLYQNDTIEIRIRSRAQELFPPGFFSPESEDNGILRWVVVAFWTEELDQPSAQGGR